MRIPRAGAYQRHKPGVMNKTERRYSEVLDIMKHANEIAEYWFEAVTFKLADDCRYTPDFLVQFPDGTLEIHEVKGNFFRDDAKVKVRVMASKFPFRILVVKPGLKGMGWQKDYFS